jgi:predicted ATPase
VVYFGYPPAHERPQHLSYLASAYAEVSQFEEAWRCISEAMTAVETTKESWYEAEVNRVAGGLALTMPEPDEAKAETYFERALAVARQQQAKSLELRAAMSMARLWRFASHLAHSIFCVNTIRSFCIYTSAKNA